MITRDMDRAVGRGPFGASAPAGEESSKAMKARVYEVAKDVGLENQQLIAKIRTLGIEVKNHMSSLEGEDVVRIKRALDKERQARLVEERLSPTVIRRRSKAGAGGSAAAAAAHEAAVEHEAAVRAAEEAEGPISASEVVADREAREARRALAAREAEEFRAQRAREEQEAREHAEREQEEAERLRREAEEKKLAEIRSAMPMHMPERPRPQAGAAPSLAPVSAGQALQQSTPAPSAASGTPAGGTAAAAPGTPGWVRPQVGDRIQLPGRPIIGSAADRDMLRGVPVRPMEVVLPTTPRIQITEDEGRGRGTRGRFGAAGPAGARGPGQKVGYGKKKQQPGGKKARQTIITTPAEHKRVIKMDTNISVSDLSRDMGIKATEVLKKLWGMGMVGVTINQSIDADTASLLAQEFGFEIQNVAFQEDSLLDGTEDKPEDLLWRAPVVTIMGHVDHGKTSLLDAIRSTDVASGEAGGITQHIGAYRVATEKGDVVFLDTPGHEAFTAMRARGAQATDIVVLVVAADDGVMPQTIEALNHAKDAEVPIVVCINKIDKPGANPDLIRQQLSQHGLMSEEWGGETIFVNVSARQKTGLDTLLESLLLQAEVLELRANPSKLGRGVVVEAKLDRNRGPMATLLVQDGTFRAGDIVVSGESFGKVRAMLDDKGRNVAEAGPSTPVELLGLDGVPDAGEMLYAVSDEKAARSLIEHRRDARRKNAQGEKSKVSLENIMSKIQEGQAKELKIVLKADVQGSAEAVREALIKLTTPKVKVNVIQYGVGGITESDVNLAKAGGAIIIGFHVRPAGKAGPLAEQEGVDIKIYEIIYEALDEVKAAMVGMLAPVKKEKFIGKAEVRKVYSIPKVGNIAGVAVTEGKITRNAIIRIVREAVMLWTGKLSSLKRFKDDAREVEKGYECGVSLENHNDIKEGDILEAFEIVEEAASLN